MDGAVEQKMGQGSARMFSPDLPTGMGGSAMGFTASLTLSDRQVPQSSREFVLGRLRPQMTELKSLPTHHHLYNHHRPEAARSGRRCHTTSYNARAVWASGYLILNTSVCVVDTRKLRCIVHPPKGVDFPSPYESQPVVLVHKPSAAIISVN